MERPAFVPHDHNDNPLKIGDIVAVPCVITGIDKHPDFINVALQTRWPMYPGENKTPIILNTSQVILVKKSEKLMDDSVHVMDVIQEIKEGSGIIKRDSGESVIE
jgi:hypothetical protein